MKSSEEYFGTPAPVLAKDVRRETAPPARHVQRQRRTVIPVVALGAVFTLMFIGVFSLGFYLGSQLTDTSPGKQSGQVFEKPLTQPLNENLPGYVEPKAPALIRKAE